MMNVMALESNDSNEKKVIEMLENNKTFKEIAKTIHVSPIFVSMVKKKILGEDASVNKRLSIPTQVLKLFSEGKSVIEVTIFLDRPISEIQGYHNDYLRLGGMDFLVSLVVVHLDHLPTISKLTKYVVQNPFAKNDLIIALNLVKDINRLKSIKNNLEEKIEYLKETKKSLIKYQKKMDSVLVTK